MSPPKTSYLILNNWKNTNQTGPKLGPYLFSWTDSAEYSQELTKFEHKNFIIDRSCSAVFNGSMLIFGGFYNPTTVGKVSGCGIENVGKMPVAMHSHSCVIYQSSVLLCGTPKNVTACIRYVLRNIKIPRISISNDAVFCRMNPLLYHKFGNMVIFRPGKLFIFLIFSSKRSKSAISSSMIKIS